MTRSALFLVSISLALASANAAATGADATCDAALVAHNSIFSTDCVAVGGVCPTSCLASFEALETSCKGKKYTDSQIVDGKDVEVALDWNTDKGAYLLNYQSIKNLFGVNDECCEVIHVQGSAGKTERKNRGIDANTYLRAVIWFVVQSAPFKIRRDSSISVSFAAIVRVE